jgi:hypothetical protein
MPASVLFTGSRLNGWSRQYLAIVANVTDREIEKSQKLDLTHCVKVTKLRVW